MAGLAARLRIARLPELDLEPDVEALYQGTMTPVIAHWWNAVLLARNGRFLSTVSPALAEQLARLPRRGNWPVVREIAQDIFRGVPQPGPGSDAPATREEAVLVVAYALISTVRGAHVDAHTASTPAGLVTFAGYQSAWRSFSADWLADWQGIEHRTYLIDQLKNDRLNVIAGALTRALDRLYAKWGAAQPLSTATSELWAYTEENVIQSGARRVFNAADVLWHAE